MRWGNGQIYKLFSLFRDNRPLYLFMDEHEKVLDTQWFVTTEEAMQHAKKFDASVVNILLYVGSAENENESFFIAPSKE